MSEGTRIDSENKNSSIVDPKRKRNIESPEDILRNTKLTRITQFKELIHQEAEMEEIKSMLSDMMLEIKEIKRNQIEQQRKMEEILEENKKMKEYSSKLEEKIEKLDMKIENLEKEKKRNNLIITGITPKAKDNQTLRFELEDFIRGALKIETKIRNAKRIGNTTCMVEMENWEEKLKILKVKSNLKNRREAKIYINNDLTDKEKEIQKSIRSREKEEREQGNRTKIGYKNLMINDKKWVWSNSLAKLIEPKN